MSLSTVLLACCCVLQSRFPDVVWRLAARSVGEASHVNRYQVMLRLRPLLSLANRGVDIRSALRTSGHMGLGRDSIVSSNAVHSIEYIVAVFKASPPSRRSHRPHSGATAQAGLRSSSTEYSS